MVKYSIEKINEMASRGREKITKNPELYEKFINTINKTTLSENTSEENMKRIEDFED
jgi:recombinational DNA repair protein (RecF pathway)